MEQLHALAQQVARQRKLWAMEESLRRQLTELEGKVRDLKQIWTREARDVETLSRTSLTGLLYELLGKKEEKLEQEQREALAAAAKYQAAAAELAAAERELAAVRAELQELRGCEERYAQAKADRANRLKAEDPVRGPEIAALEAELSGLAAQRQELREALDVGHQALSTARDVQDELDGARDWGTWDLLGGGILADMAKHERLDNAQTQINRLQIYLRRFRTELADVKIQANVTLQIDEFLRFADWFFDGLIVDWTVQSKIQAAQNEIYGTICQIQTLLDRLDNLNQELLHREDRTREKLDELLLAE